MKIVKQEVQYHKFLVNNQFKQCIIQDFDVYNQEFHVLFENCNIAIVQMCKSANPKIYKHAINFGVEK